ncbi:MAG: DUF488 domain-containing protein [Rhodospirillaceae bacterium]|nr:DUF488 domain-containing protein [Rhodospirillaceae bacterium]MDD9929589.1 DUF488 domain-containing protein [Rhodospirillaceae bacterium]
MFQVKRIYEPRDAADGYRVLVDRMWPRGVSKETAAIDLWLKEIGPSTALRKWFGHDPAKWDGFRSRYAEELEAGEVVETLRQLGREHDVVTLLYSARDEEHNQAIALQDYLENQ